MAGLIIRASLHNSCPFISGIIKSVSSRVTVEVLSFRISIASLPFPAEMTEKPYLSRMVWVEFLTDVSSSTSRMDSDFFYVVDIPVNLTGFYLCHVPALYNREEYGKC